MKRRNWTYLKCEDCRKQGRCERELTAFRWFHVKGCMVEVKEKTNKEDNQWE
ncbi:MAG: hypothetical protein J6Q22_10980 [Prevotella sp.]|nr:hypothetical protein [Prevotella sp.]